MRTFAGIEEQFADPKRSAVLLQPIPYDGTSTWGKGADRGFEAFMTASENMELYDIETDSEVYRRGVHILPPIIGSDSPEALCASSRAAAAAMIETGRFPTFFGGEHSISIGVMQAFIDKWPNITILQLDAHADLRPEYAGTKCNHACAMHAAALQTEPVQVGIRSMDSVEKPFMRSDRVFFAEDIHRGRDWMTESIALMNEDVYVTIDLDVFDPSIMPATGTPEPGGLDWNTTIDYLRKVFSSRNVRGFDIVELCPIDGFPAPDFLAAKLYYKMLSYRFENEK